VKFWDSTHEKVEELKKMNFRIRHGHLNKLLEENRSE